MSVRTKLDEMTIQKYATERLDDTTGALAVKMSTRVTTMTRASWYSGWIVCT